MWTSVSARSDMLPSILEVFVPHLSHDGQQRQDWCESAAATVKLVQSTKCRVSWPAPRQLLDFRLGHNFIFLILYKPQTLGLIDNLYHLVCILAESVHN